MTDSNKDNFDPGGYKVPPELWEELFAETPEEVEARLALNKIYAKFIAIPKLSGVGTVRLNPDFVTWLADIERNRMMRIDPLSVWRNGPPTYFCGVPIYRDPNIVWGDCVVEYMPDV